MIEARNIVSLIIVDRFGALSPSTVEFLELHTLTELSDLAVKTLHADDLCAVGVPE